MGSHLSRYRGTNSRRATDNNECLVAEVHMVSALSFMTENSSGSSYDVICTQVVDIGFTSECHGDQHLASDGVDQIGHA